MVKFISNFEINDKEKKMYLDKVTKDIEKNGYHEAKNLQEIKLNLNDNNEVTVDYVIANDKFERIRRITGYLTGNINSWNDAKRSELADRVKHC
jgi:anaerobic ribonucleoside-triphosphate reductase